MEIMEDKPMFGSKNRGEHNIDYIDETPTSYEEFDECYCEQEFLSTGDIIPYISVYDTSEEEKKRPFFIPSKAVVATIVGVRQNTEHIMHITDSYVYTIKLTHAHHVWMVERCYSDFSRLNNRLRLFRAAQALTGPLKKLVGEDTREINYTTLTYKSDDGLTEENVQPMGKPKPLPAPAGVVIDSSSTSQAISGPAGTVIDNASSNRRNSPPSTSNKPEPSQMQQGTTVKVLYKASSETVQPSTTTDSQQPENQKQKHSHKMPKFPFLPDTFVSQESLEKRKEDLQRYLNAVLRIQSLRNHKEMAEFLEVSHLSFVHNLGIKRKEGAIRKRHGGRFRIADIRMYCHEYCAYCCKYWDKRWLVVKDSFIAYINPGTNVIREVLLFDPVFEVRTSSNSTGNDSTKKEMEISNYTRTLRIKIDSRGGYDEWKTAIDEALHSTGKVWLDVQQFGSFSPPRHSTYAQWFVDGRSFMSHLSDMLELAKEEIFIAGWFFTAEIFLKRPPLKQKQSLLMDILKRKAEQGVHVFVMIWKEFELAIQYGSGHAKRTLMALHPKILVMRHPNPVPPTWWSHHEKMVVIDQNIAFIGGIDLSLGRWDDYSHRLVDLGREPVCVTDLSLNVSGIGQSKSKVKQRSVDAESYAASSLTDMIKQESRDQPVTYDNDVEKAASEHSTKKPDFEKLREKYQEYMISNELKKRDSRQHTPPLSRKKSKWKRVVENWKERYIYDNSLYGEYENMLAQEFDKAAIDDPLKHSDAGQIWLGKDYVNFLYKDLIDLEHPYLDFIDRETMCRLPWHDISSVVYGSAARDAGRHFIQRWNQIKNEKYNYDNRYPFIVPKSYENSVVPQVFRRVSHRCTAQVLRSACSWSVGINCIEESIHQAYCHIITNAQHYVYIENQYFITMINSSEVRNLICKALFERIVKAHRMNQKFRVIITLPLLPAFPGELGTLTGLHMQTILYYTYKCIWKGPHSLIEKLEKEIGDWSQYVAFYAMRTHANLCGRLISEVVYVHSKIIIVDDRHAIIGSANLNDRSMMGDGDSELCVYIEDTDFVQSTMNDRPFNMGKFCGSFRKQIFSEHLGLLDDYGRPDPNAEIDIDDFVSDRVFNFIKQRAYMNTVVYEKVFNCYPTDSVKTFAQLETYKKNSQSCLANINRSLAEAELSKIEGFIVEFPTKFLCDENLQPTVLSYQGFAERYTASYV